MLLKTCFVSVFLLILDATVAAERGCLCVTGSTKKIYTSPEVTREEIGLAIRGECLPVAHTNDENESWVAVDFKKNIIFHQFHLIGYIMRDSTTVYRRCTAGQAIAFLTTAEPFPTSSPTTTAEPFTTSSPTTTAEPFPTSSPTTTAEPFPTSSPTTEVTTTEETITKPSTPLSNGTTSVTMETTLISTLKPTSDITSGDIMTTLTSTDGTHVESTTEIVTIPPTKEPDTMSPTKEPDTMPPTKEPDTMSPTKEPDTLSPTKEPDTMPPTKEPDTMSPTKEPFTLPPTKEPATTEITSDRTTSNDLMSTTSNVFPAASITSTLMTRVTAKGTGVTRNTDVPRTTSSSISHTGDLTTVAMSPSTVFPTTNTTTSSCDPVCLNGGTCVTDPFVACLCYGGWSGASCDVCAGTTCDQGSCVMLGATPQCVCDPGYTGVSCNESHVCNGSDVSIGGKCYTFNYVYETCQENYCMNQPGTECLVNSEGIYCLCQDEFNPQDSTPCGCPSGYVRHLNGTCVEIDCRGVSSCSHGSCFFRSFYNFGCLCDEGWKGENCDMGVTQCGAHHCNNNGTCVHDPDARCRCADAWTGVDCDICGTQPCHHGVCITDRYQQSMCVCDQEYSGPNCDKVVPCSGQEFGGHCYGNDLENFTPCVENVCMAGQLCVAALHTFKNDLYCVCKENVTEAYMTSDCGCPERSLRNYRGECVDILL